MAEALVQGGLIGATGELPERYMHVIVAGTAGSGNFYCYYYYYAVIKLLDVVLVMYK